MKRVGACGVSLSAVGLGTWQFGSSEWGYGSAYASDVAPRIVRRSLELGVTLFDTAELYGFGRSETILGRALGDRRPEAFVATKLFPVAPVAPVVGWRLHGSLRRLGTEAVDLYQLHWPNPVVPDSATARALAPFVEDGTVRHVGVSNYPLTRWRELERLLGIAVPSNQVRYSLIDRRAEADLLPYAREHGRILIAHSPLAQGLLSGRYDEDHRPAGMRGRTAAFWPENLRRMAPLVDLLRDVAAAHDATPAQVALAWLLRRPNVVVIPGASSVEQAEANAEAASLELDDDEDRALDAASAAVRLLSGRVVAGAALTARAQVLARRVRRTLEAVRA